MECRGASDEDPKRKAVAQSGATNELPCLGGAGARCRFFGKMLKQARMLRGISKMRSTYKGGLGSVFEEVFLVFRMFSGVR